MILSKIIADISRENNNTPLYALAISIRVAEIVAVLSVIWLFITIGSLIFQ